MFYSPNSMLIFLFTFLVLISYSSCLINITNCTELHNISLNLTENFILTSNINCTFFSFSPIGNSTSKFKGTLDGQNNEIFGLSIQTTGSNVAIFAFADQCTIKNLVLKDVYISTNSGFVGILFGDEIGCNVSDIQISTTVPTASNIIVSTSSANFIGGLVK